MNSISVEDYLEYLRRGEIPPAPPTGTSVGGWGLQLDVEKMIESFTGKEEAHKLGMWALVDTQWTRELAEWIGGRKCLEVMAGRGWLAKGLAEHGCSIVATDSHSEDWHIDHWKDKEIFPVQSLSAEDAVKQHSDAEILICSWPPFGNTDFDRACEIWGSEKPIIYIAERGGGCTGSEAFWQHFVSAVFECGMQAWPGIHDYVNIGLYKPD